MLAIEVELLTERYSAMAYNDRTRAEWPPHPVRLFSALVDTWAEDDGTEPEALALRWLESQPPPRVHATRAYPRSSAQVFVPVNDVQTVAEPAKQRAKVIEAIGALNDATDTKSRSKAEKALAKAEAKLLSDSKKAAEASKITKEGIKSATAILPGSRMRQPRTFPSVVPSTPTVVFEWASEPPDSVRTALAGLCARMVRLGHSSSLVRASLAGPPSASNDEVFVPDSRGEEVLRVPSPGQLDRLREAFELHRGLEPRILPARFERYRRGRVPAPEVAESVFGDAWVVLERVGGDRFPIERAGDLGTAVRRALIRYADEPVHEIISGHRPDGQSSEQPHAAFVPLPFVGSTHARGDLLGVALILPRGVDEAARRALARAVGRWEAEVRDADPERAEEEAPELVIALGRGGAMVARRVPFGEAARSTLRPQTWTRPSRLWMTATPIALDRNPGDLHAADPVRRAKSFDEAEATVARACQNIGLPAPEHVDVLRSATMPGTAKPRRYPPFPPRRDRPRRVLVHARLVFAEPVRGPILIGAGRYVGLGLCRPIREREA